MEEASDENNFPQPVFKTRKLTYSGRVTCSICFESCLKRNAKRCGFQEISNRESFRHFAEKWAKYDHVYNKVYSNVDWSSTKELNCHKSCRGKFMKESLMILQKEIEQVPMQVDQPGEDQTPGSSDKMEIDVPEMTVRRSSRKSCSYVSTKDDKEKVCIICNEQKRSKGRLVPVIDITYKKSADGIHLAEKSLLEFSKLHLKYESETYKIAANRILLACTIKSLFEADVVYHKDCYANFRSPYWYEKYSKLEIAKMQSEENQSQNSEEDFFKLIHHHIVSRQEIYTLAQLTNYCNGIFKTQAKLRSVDLKKKLMHKFGEKLTFIERNGVNESEFVLVDNDIIMSDCLKAMSLSEGIEDSITVKNVGKLIGRSLISMNENKEKKWPPTPQEIINSELKPYSDLLYNLIGWIVCPDASYGEDGIVKLPPTKVPKVIKLCTDIESLVPHATPSLNQVLLSLSEYRKTGSSNLVNDLSKLGHGITYTETKFIEDKWAEWSENSSKIVPSNIKPGVIPTLVSDNIDWENKNFHGKQTHNTNSILI